MSDLVPKCGKTVSLQNVFPPVYYVFHQCYACVKIVAKVVYGSKSSLFWKSSQPHYSHEIIHFI